MALAGIGDRVEGIHAVAAAIAAGRVHTLHVEGARLGHDDVAALIDAARRCGATVEVEDDVRPMASTGAPQGVVAQAHPIAPSTLDDAVVLADPPLIVVLDHLEDPRNVGAIARSALAAGVPALVVPTRRAAPLGPTAFKAAAGALEQISVVPVSSIPDTLRRLSQLGLWTVGLAGGAATSLWDFDLLSQPVALVVGGEGRGLHRLVAQRCDALVRIPMEGATESLNASVAAALAMFEVARVRGR
jgi:23S rRNA (guanosine2251-2'-O)-methyltransferase